METLKTASIRTDGGTQTRAQIDMDTFVAYKRDLEDGAVFPPVTVFHDGSEYWLADGFHRLRAHQALDRREISADVRQGTQRDAILHSVGANASHGLRRSNADKRRAVETLLRDDEWRKMSDREIASHAKVSHPFVGKIRRELEDTGNITSANERVTANGTTMKTSTINEKRQTLYDKFRELCRSKDSELLLVRVHLANEKVYIAPCNEAFLQTPPFSLKTSHTQIPDGTIRGRTVIYVKVDEQATSHLKQRFSTDIIDQHEIMDNDLDNLFSRMSKAGRLNTYKPSTPSSKYLDRLKALEVPGQSDDYPLDERLPLKPGDTVITRTGRVGTVNQVNGRQIAVQDVNGVRTHNVETLTLQQAASLELTPEQKNELVASFNVLLKFAGGADVNLDMLGTSYDHIQNWLDEMEF